MNKLFRLPMCTKIGQQRYLIITPNHTFNDALLTFIDESSKFVDAYIYEKPKKERISKVEKNFIEQITDILKTKYNDYTSEYCHDYSNYLEHIISKLVENAPILTGLSMNKRILLLIIILKKHH